MTIKLKVVSVLKHFPRIKAILNRIRLQCWKLAFQLKTMGKERDSEFRTLYINPSKIRYTYKGKKFNKWKDKGKVLGGNWDKEKMLFEEMDAYRAFRDWYERGVAWEDTPFYQRIFRMIEKGEAKWGCTNKAEFDNRLKELETLFEEIRDSGYKCQAEIPETKKSHLKLYDEITVLIDRDGRLLFDDGRHRLIIAKLLGLEKVPIHVTLRHKKWYDFKREILAYANRSGGKIYTPLLHPDLADIPSYHTHTRFELIKANLPFKKGDLLDIGAHWGYFCHKFEEEGFNCFAVEASEQNFYFLEKLRNTEDKKFHIIKGSILEYNDKSNFDIVLALNIFHHFFKTETQFNQLIAFLNRLDMRVMFFGPHKVSEKQMENAYKNFQPEEFVSFVLANSCLSNSKMIGKTEDDRILYMLWK